MPVLKLNSHTVYVLLGHCWVSWI